MVFKELYSALEFVSNDSRAVDSAWNLLVVSFALLELSLPVFLIDDLSTHREVVCLMESSFTLYLVSSLSSVTSSLPILEMVVLLLSSVKSD